MKMKKITTFLLLVCMLVGVFGKVNVYAASSTESSFNDFVFNFRLIDEYGDYKYKVDVTDSDSYKIIHVINNSMHSAVIISKNTFSYTRTYIVDWLTNDSYATDTATGTAACCSGNSDDAIVYLSNVIIGGDCTLTGSFYGTFDATGYSGDELYQAYYEILCGNSPDGFTRDTSGFDEDSATYDKNLGYLQNVKFTALYSSLWDEVTNSYKKDDVNGKYRFQWGNLSTSGFDLTTSNTFIRLYTSVGVYDSVNEFENLCNNFPKNFIQQYPASELQLRISISDFLAGSQDDFDEIYSSTLAATWITKGYYRRDTSFLQIVNCDDAGNWTYGGYLKIYVNEDGDLIGYPVTPDGGIDIDSGGSQEIPTDEEITGDSGSNGDNSEGDGDDSGDDDDFSFNWSDTPDLLSDIASFFTFVLDAVKDLINQVGDFPALFGRVLAFLPDAIQTAILTGFVMAIILRVFGR